MPTALVVNGAAPRAPMASGRLNSLLAETAQAELGSRFSVLTTVVADGYDAVAERRKFLAADLVVFQFPVYWFALPPGMKAYVDDVYAYGEFFGPARHYGRGGLLVGKDYLVSSTWNAASSDFGSADTVIGRRSVDEVLVAFHLTQQYVGMTPLRSFATFDVVRRPDARASADRWREHLRRHVPDVRAGASG